MIDILLLLNYISLLVYIIINIRIVRAINKKFVIFMGIIGIIGNILFLQGEILSFNSNLHIIHFNIIEFMYLLIPNPQIWIFIFVILIIMQFVSLRLFRCIESLSAIFNLEDKVLDAMNNIQNNTEITYEYARIDNAENICKTLLKINIVSIILIVFTIIEIFLINNLNVFSLLFFSYTLFQLPILIIAIVTIIPMTQKYKISRYYEMGYFARKNPRKKKLRFRDYCGRNLDIKV